MAQILSDLLSSMGRVDQFALDTRTQAEREEYDRVKAALNEEAKENWDSEAWHREQAAILASRLDYGFQFENLFSTYFLTRNVPEFEKVWLRERTGLKVFYTHRGGYIEESQLRTEDWELPRDTLGFHVSEHEDKLRANFAESIEAIASLGAQRMEAEINRRAFSLLQEAIPTSSDYYVDASSTGLSAVVLNDAIREVMDAIKPTGTGPVPVTVAGRMAALADILDFDGFADEAKEEIRLRGRLGVYRGANLMYIRNYTDENGVSYISDDEVWVFGGTVGLFAKYGDTRTKSWAENTVDYRHYRSRQDIGGLVHHPEQARRIKVA